MLTFLLYIFVLFIVFVLLLCQCVMSFPYMCVQSPPASAKVPKSVSDRKRFFENAMEDQNKPAPKTGKSHLRFLHFIFRFASSNL